MGHSTMSNILGWTLVIVLGLAGSLAGNLLGMYVNTL